MFQQSPGAGDKTVGLGLGLLTALESAAQASPLPFSTNLVQAIRDAICPNCLIRSALIDAFIVSRA